MKKTGKKFLLLGVSLLCVMIFLGCAQEKEEPIAHTEKLSIGLLRIDDSLPFYIAEKEGLFEQHGVQVELIGFNSGKDQSIALESGELDGIMTDMIVQGLIKKSGTDIKAVAMALGANAEEGRFLVIAAPHSDIRKPKDLEGKTVAISNNTMMDYLLETMTEIEDIDFGKITTVNMPDLMLRVTTLLEGKDIDAAILPDPLAAYAVREGGHIVIDDTQLSENLSQSVVAITAEALENKHDAVTKMLDAYNEAIDLVNSHPDEYRTFCLETANVPQVLADTYPTPTYTVGAIPDKASVQRVVDWLVTRGLIDQPYSYEDMVAIGFVQ